MPSNITSQQVEQIVHNLHNDPFEILGIHLLSEEDDKKNLCD